MNVSDFVARILPSCFVMAFVLSVRTLGLLEPLELVAFDTFLKLRPLELPDDRITLIKITQEDIERWGGYPISIDKITELIEQLQVHKPTVIGLNLLDDLLPEDKQKLTSLFQRYDNLIISEKILPPQILAPQEISSEKVGFVDIDIDRDQYLRRILLGTANPVNSDDLSDFKFSFTIRLADKFLASHGYILENGKRNPDAMRYGTTEIPLIEKNYGGYIDIDDGGIQTFINYRQHPIPFNEMSISDIEKRNNPIQTLSNNIIIIGVIDPITRGNIKTSSIAISSTGIDIQGHAISQIVSGVKDGRNLISWSLEYEYIYAFIWLALYFILAIKLDSIKVVILFTFIILFLSWIFLILGYWVSLGIPILFLVVNGFVSWSIGRIREERSEVINEQKQKTKIQRESDLRQNIIERIFLVIHNGPLQTLSDMIRVAKDKGDFRLTEKLEKLDQEIRSIGDFSRSKSNKFERLIYLGNNQFLDLELPVHELLYSIFSKTVERDLIELKKIKIKVRSFDPIDSYFEKYISLQNKRDLCWFLEEMLCNIGKHGVDVSRLKAIGTFNVMQKTYSLKIEDNGSVLDLSHQGEGTKRAKQIALSRQGSFRRQQLETGGTICELIWSLRENQILRY